MKTPYTIKDYNKYSKKIEANKVDFVYLLNGVSNMTVPKEIETTLKERKLLDKVKNECYKSMFEVVGTYINNIKCLTSPMNSLFISYKELNKPIKSHYKDIDTVLKIVNPFEVYELQEIKVAFAALFIDVLRDNADDVGIIVEPLKVPMNTKLTLMDPDIVIDTTKNIPIKLLSEIVDLGSRYELIVEVHNRENDLINLIDEADGSDRIENWVFDFNIRKKLLTYKEDVKRLSNYISAVKNMIAMEKLYEC